MGLTLIEAMVFAPLAAVDPTNPDVIHAVTFGDLPVIDWETAATATAACGAAVKLLPCPWPVPTKHTERRRCTVCRLTVGGRASSQTARWWAKAANAVEMGVGGEP